MHRRHNGNLLLALIALVSCTGDQPLEPAAERSASRLAPTVSASTADEGQGEPDGRNLTLLYLEGKTLRTFDVESRSSETVARLPTSDATSSGDGSHVVYITSSIPAAGDEDFITSPELHLYEVSSGRDTTVGPGTSPLWHPTGQKFAYLEPSDARGCAGEACRGSNSLVVAEIKSQKRTTFSRGEVYAPLAWLGESVVVSRRLPEPSAFAISASGEAKDLRIPPAEFWGASPDGAWVVRSVAGRVDFVATDSGTDSVRVAMPDSLLGEGAWSPHSSRLAAVSLHPSGSSRLVLLSPSDNGYSTVPDSRGAAGPVMWSQDGRTFAFTRASGRRGLDTEAVICGEAGNAAGDCRALFSWARGVTILSLR